MIASMSAGIKFFQKVEVVDPDDASKIYCFDLDDPQHCACFNISTTYISAVRHCSPPSCQCFQTVNPASLQTPFCVIALQLHEQGALCHQQPPITVLPAVC